MKRGVWLLLGIVACGEPAPHPRDFTLDIPSIQSPIAIRAAQELLVLDGCMAPSSCETGNCCTTQVVTNVRAEPADPIVRTTVARSTVNVAAMSVGETTVRITADLEGNPAEIIRRVDVREPERVLLDAPIQETRFGENPGASCLSPVLTQIGVIGYVGYRALAGGLPLVTTGWSPLTLEGNAITLTEIGGKTFQPRQYFRADNVGMATLSANVGGEVSVRFEVVTAEAIDGMLITGHDGRTLQERSVDVLAVSILPTSGMRELCADMQVRNFEITTPATCQIDERQIWPNPPNPTSQVMPEGTKSIAIRGLDPGTCAFTAQFEGTSYTSAGSFEVLPR